MTAIRAAADGTKIGPLLSGQTDYLSLDRISLSSLFDSDTVFVNITCSVSNFFGGDDMTTSVTVCGECVIIIIFVSSIQHSVQHVSG